MGDWGFISKLLDKVQSHSTSIGKVWMTVLLVFRIMVLGAGVEKVWGDEQSKMVCNTNSPGCRNVCYDAAFPISHTRFWVLQIVFVSSPTLVYLGYVLHVIHKEDKLRRKLAERRGGTKVPRYTDDRGKIRHTGSLLCIYIMCIMTTILLESGFIAGQYLLYGFVMYPIIKCNSDPCPSVGAECIISRPTEKTVIIIFMLVVACVSVLLNIAEIFYLMGRASAFRERSLEAPRESDEDTVYNETHC